MSVTQFLRINCELNNVSSTKLVMYVTSTINVHARLCCESGVYIHYVGQARPFRRETIHHSPQDIVMIN